MNISLFKNGYDYNKPEIISLKKFKEQVRDGVYKKEIDIIKNCNTKEEAAPFKMKLPAVVFTGVLHKGVEMQNKKTNEKYISYCTNDSVSEWSGLIVLDFDYKTFQEAKAKKEELMRNPHTLMCFYSPSYKGVKAIFKIKHPLKHREHFEAIKEKYPDVDKSGINEARLCFISYDPEIYTNYNFKEWEELPKVKEEKKEDSKRVQVDYSKLEIACRMIRNASDGERNVMLLKAAKLLGGYIAVGKMEETIAYNTLLQEIAIRRGGTNREDDSPTIWRGLEYGKKQPIGDTYKLEKEVIKQMKLNDGDFSFISNEAEDFDFIIKYIKGEIPKGEPLFIDMAEHFRLKRAWFSLFGGNSNVGKTTVLLFIIAASVVKYKWRWAVYIQEDKIASAKMVLMRFIAQKEVNNMNENEIKACYQFVCQYVIFITNKELYSASELLLFAEKLSKKETINALLIDPYNALKVDLKGEHPYSFHQSVVQEMQLFPKKTGISLFLNVHPNTSAQRAKDENGMAKAPSIEDAEWGAMFKNKADDAIILHRLTNSPDRKYITEWHQVKVRDKELYGGDITPYAVPYELNYSRLGFKLNGEFMMKKINFGLNDDYKPEIPNFDIDYDDNPF